MRDIKFRAWDGLRMTCCGITFNNTTWSIQNVNGEPIMQYTGLKDKNGVEIYEGDFVSHWHEEMFFQGNVVGLVVWQPDTACFEFEYSSTSQPFSNVDFNYIEPQIIGNIYENPELVDE